MGNCDRTLEEPENSFGGETDLGGGGPGGPWGGGGGIPSPRGPNGASSGNVNLILEDIAFPVFP